MNRYRFSSIGWCLVVGVALVGCDRQEPGNLVSNQDGTPIGNLTGYGGLSSAFDGNMAKVSTSCSAHPGGEATVAPAGYNSFIGKDWGPGASKRINGFRLFSSTNLPMGIMQTAALNLKLQGSNDGQAWRDLFIGAGMAKGVVPNLTVDTGIDISKAYRFHRISLQGNGLNAIVICQVQFSEILEKK